MEIEGQQQISNNNKINTRPSSHSSISTIRATNLPERRCSEKGQKSDSQSTPKKKTTLIDNKQRENQFQRIREIPIESINGTINKKIAIVSRKNLASIDSSFVRLILKRKERKNENPQLTAFLGNMFASNFTVALKNLRKSSQQQSFTDFYQFFLSLSCMAKGHTWIFLWCK